MAKKKSPVKIYVWPTKHKGTDVWVFAVDKPGPGPNLKPSTRYTRRHGAVMGGARSINAYRHRQYSCRTGGYVTLGWKTQDGRDIEFVYSKPKKK